MEPVTVATFNEVETAKIVRQRLENEGMASDIYDESKVQKFWFLCQPRASVRLRVDRSNFERARELLKAWTPSEPALHAAIHCPACGSSRVEYPQFTRKFILHSFGAVLMALGLIQPNFFCQECHFTWPPKTQPQPDRDALGWPRKEAHSKTS